jgi:hypothetical protein
MTGMMTNDMSGALDFTTNNDYDLKITTIGKCVK